MTYSATLIKIKDAEKMGEYTPTIVDKQKKDAEFLLIDCSFGYTIRWKDGRQENMKKRAFEKLCKAHTWATDF